MYKIKIGDVVISLKGKDAGTKMSVVGLKDGFAYVADGKHYGVVNPKKKNLKHLKVIVSVSDNELSEKIKSGKPIGCKTLKRYIFRTQIKKEEQLNVER